MNLTVDFKRNEGLGKLLEAAGPRNRARLHERAADGVANLVRNHLLGIASWRHFTADRLGGGRTGHLEKGSAAISHTWDETAGTVHVPIPGIGRAFHDVTVRATRAKALTIPVDGVAYGHRVSELMAFGYKMFKLKTARSTVLMGAAGGEKPRPLYVLKASVTQPRDPTLMPTEEEIRDTAARAMMALIRKAKEAARRMKAK